MKLYFAPLEGVTTPVYRNTHIKMFDYCDGYYAPFITPGEDDKMTRKLFKEVLPENNKKLKVQVLTNSSKAFLNFSKKLEEIGYDEVNINLGCPSGTVVKKNKGSAFLRDTEALDSFLYEIFEKSNIKISIKTRIGFSDSNEMEKLMEIYNKYPLELLIIHPRTREQFYKGNPDIECFQKAYSISKNKLCYNGDIFTVDDYKRIITNFPKLDSVMIGRGAIKNPALFREIKGGAVVLKNELLEFAENLSKNYKDVLGSDIYVLHKLKEVWVYMIENFPDEKKVKKALHKATKLNDFENAIKML
ncbi:MAG: tRNA-dihydrouridine synthase family protein [Clostridia bacterium]|nr:tRNA-dihydrouridine synthase family protein [Clostridia bacterium]